MAKHVGCVSPHLPATKPPATHHNNAVPCCQGPPLRETVFSQREAWRMRYAPAGFLDSKSGSVGAIAPRSNTLRHHELKGQIWMVHNVGSLNVDDDKSSRRLPYGEGRQALVNAAIKLVAREGLPRLTYRSLTAEAGVTQGSLRHHFPHLIGVLEAALESCLDVSNSYLARPKRQVDELLGHMIQMMHEQPEIPAFLAEVYIEARHAPELLEIVQRHQANYRNRVRISLEAAGLAVDDEVIDVVLAIGDGMMYQRVIFGHAHEEVTQRQVSGTQRLLLALLFKEQVGAISKHLGVERD